MPLVHSLMAGSAVMMIGRSMAIPMNWVLVTGILLNLGLIGHEMLGGDHTPDAAKAIKMMKKGRYAAMFRTGLLLGNLLPLLLLGLALAGIDPLDTGAAPLAIASGALAAAGIYLTEFVRIRVPQLIPLN